MRRKLILGVSIALLGGLLLAGCGGSKGDGASGAKEITFWNPFTGADGSNMKKMIDEYNKTNPEFKIKNVSLKETDLYAKIPTVVNSGKNIPDLTIVHAERIKQFKDNGMLKTYDGVLQEFPDIKAENYVAEAWNLGEIDGERYSLPLDIHSWGTYYNKDLLKKYAPDALDDDILTYDEIIAAGEKAKADDVRGIAVTWVKPNYLSLMAQYGGELTSDGTAPTLDITEGKQAFDMWNNMYEKGVTTQDGEDPTQLFLSEKLLFFPEGIWIQNNIKNATFEWGLTNSPQLSNDLSKTINWASSHQFVMFNSKDRSEDKEKGIGNFIDWLRDNSLEWAKAGQNPATLSLLEDSEYMEMPQSLFLKTKEEQETLKIFDYKYNGYVSEYLDAHGFDTIFGKVPVADTMKDMQKEISDKIAKDDSGK
ncbi:extracellular solute-binding protein [Enterococcus termitis]|uniref:Sugar ABC transporter substrate-binding protein n=1 Tax=Enterococcus termitis TaxID=332950 RepID=A0A1E5H4V0_9ENTE|nr:extracellular solute-binding protein [Enterococcus termitis]OEG19943.1 sugar ABC transporter substrate-binding protein [Enterococcus termitis]OJG97729.1 sugar ABC transporter substrate-binding protein [Enterococcus termitis]